MGSGYLGDLAVTVHGAIAELKTVLITTMPCGQVPLQYLSRLIGRYPPLPFDR